MKRGREFLPAPDQDGAALPLKRVDETLLRALIDEAARRGITLTGDRDLLAMVASVEGEEQIPRELYAAIAVALSWVDGLAAVPPATKKTKD